MKITAYIKVLSITFLCLAASAVFAGPFKPDSHTLFLAHFDTKITPDVAKGSSAAYGNPGITSGNKGKFGEALVLSRVPGVYSLNPVSQVQYDADGNFPRGEEGTMEFYFYLLQNPEEFDGAGSYVRVELFRNFSAKAGDSQAMYLYFARLRDRKVPGPLYFWVNNRPEGSFNCYAPTSVMQKNKWYHLAISWDKSKIYMFLDGKLTSDASRVNFPTLWPRLEIGGYLFDGLVDELRISDICRYSKDFNPEDI